MPSIGLKKIFFKKVPTLKELVGEVIDMWTGSYNQWLQFKIAAI